MGGLEPSSLIEVYAYGDLQYERMLLQLYTRLAMCTLLLDSIIQLVVQPCAQRPYAQLAIIVSNPTILQITSREHG